METRHVESIEVEAEKVIAEFEKLKNILRELYSERFDNSLQKKNIDEAELKLQIYQYYLEQEKNIILEIHPEDYAKFIKLRHEYLLRNDSLDAYLRNAEEVIEKKLPHFLPKYRELSRCLLTKTLHLHNVQENLQFSRLRNDADFNNLINLRTLVLQIDNFIKQPDQLKAKELLRDLKETLAKNPLVDSKTQRSLYKAYVLTINNLQYFPDEYVAPIEKVIIDGRIFNELSESYLKMEEELKLFKSDSLDSFSSRQLQKSSSSTPKTNDFPLPTARPSKFAQGFSLFPAANKSTKDETQLIFGVKEKSLSIR